MVCDTVRDLQAAHAAGCEPHVVRTGRAAGLPDAEIATWTAGIPGARVHDSLSDFAHFVLHRDHKAQGVDGEDSAPLPMSR